MEPKPTKYLRDVKNTASAYIDNDIIKVALLILDGAPSNHMLTKPKMSTHWYSTKVLPLCISMISPLNKRES